MNKSSLGANLFAEDHPPIVRVTSLEFAAKQSLSITVVNYALQFLEPKIRSHWENLRFFSSEVPKKTELEKRYIRQESQAGNYRKPAAGNYEYLRDNWSFIPGESTHISQTISAFIITNAQRLHDLKGENVELTSGEIVRFLRIRKELTQEQAGQLVAEYEDEHIAFASAASVGIARKKGTPLQISYVNDVERNKTSVSDQRLLNFMVALEATKEEINAVKSWRNKPRLAALQAPESYGECLHQTVKLGWPSLIEFAREQSRTGTAATRISTREITKVTGGETLPNKAFNAHCRLGLKRKSLDKAFDKAIAKLAEKSKEFFLAKMLAANDFAEFILLCRLHLCQSTNEFAKKLGYTEYTTICYWENGSKMPTQGKTIQKIIDVAALKPELADKLKALLNAKWQQLKNSPEDKAALKPELERLRFNKQINSDHIFLPISDKQLCAASHRSSRNR